MLFCPSHSLQREMEYSCIMDRWRYYIWYSISFGRINLELDSIALVSELRIVHIIHHFSNNQPFRPT